MPQWALLPSEIRLQILEAVTQNPSSVRPKTGFARFSVVCREWQAFFEPRLYLRLALSQRCLDRLGQLAGRRRGLVQHLWLRIELAEYICPGCDACNRLASIGHRDADTVAKAITKLFVILASWKKDALPVPSQLVFELSLYSPSDSQHFFKGDLHLDADSLDIDFPDGSRSPVHDPAHGWSCGRRTSPPPRPALTKLFKPVAPLFPRALPAVDFVIGFIMRRQTRHSLSPMAIADMVKKLPALEFVGYEPWRFYDCSPGLEHYTDIGYGDLVTQALPGTLRRLVIFEDFNEDYDITLYFDAITNDRPRTAMMRTPHTSIGQALARRSLQLDRLCASFVTEASHFFRARQPNWVWPSLEVLSLTSSWLQSCIPSERINDLLASAGAAALQMPVLQTLEIWHGKRQTACAFRYCVTETQATISWSGTMRLSLAPEVLEIWRKVVQRHTRHELSVLPSQVLDKRAITSHASAMQALKLSGPVIHPQSLVQIEKESKWQFFP